LNAYAKEKGAKKDKWYIVTGDKREIYRLARKVYFAATTKGDGGASDFIHTENFVLVDPNGRLRGFYDGTSHPDIERLVEDIKVLKNEFDL
jgi:protein SCO1/2